MKKMNSGNNSSKAVFVLKNLDDTAHLGRKIATALQPGMTLLLRGELGAGKTALVREICRSLGWNRTCSPSFALVNEYAGARIPIAHADLYRLENVDGRDFGFDDYLDDGWVLIVEWPERLARADLSEVWDCEMTTGTARTFTICAWGEKSCAALLQLGKMNE